ncbi:MAG: hypothetical protein J3K34DRAFT_523738 [Monoraphidium minutum]|nr:MAG: hypothetical protein J3K34DRAFT_523738 [Monoraphidium minutum]
MAEQMARGPQLALPFPPWSGKAPPQMCRLLFALGCHDAPAWRAACPVHGPSAPPDASPWLGGAAPGSEPDASDGDGRGGGVGGDGSGGGDGDGGGSARADWERCWNLTTDGGGAPAWRRRGVAAAAPAEAAAGGGAAAPSAAKAARQITPHITCWASHYAAAGLSVASPAALLLHHPLSLWHCLAAVLPGRGRPLPRAPGPLVIHYLGPREELAYLPVFLELPLLLPPGTHVALHMVGPDVPPAQHGAARAWRGLPGGGSLEIVLWSGAYHEVMEGAAAAAAAAAHGDHARPQQQRQRRWEGQQQQEQGGEQQQQEEEEAEGQGRQQEGRMQGAAGPSMCGGLAAPPHLVFAPNAGLPAFPSWLPTLTRLLAPRAGAPAAGGGAAGSVDAPETLDRGAGAPPSFLATDYCEEAAHQSLLLLDGLAPGRCDVRGAPGPFRRPPAARGHGTRLPAWGNGFVFGWV